MTASQPTAPNAKPFSNGDFLLWRKVGPQLRKGLPGGPGGHGGNPRFRHQTRQAAEDEAARLLALFPESTFVVLQEVARVKLKPIDPEAAAGCAGFCVVGAICANAERPVRTAQSERANERRARSSIASRR